MKFHWKRLAFLSVAVCAVAVAAATANGSSTKNQATELTALIGSSGPAETNAVQRRQVRVDEEDGHQGQRHRRIGPRAAARPGLRVGQSARHLLSRQRPGRDVRQGRQPRAARQAEERQVVLPEPAGRVHLQGSPVRRAEGLLDARPRHQHGLVEEGGPDGEELPEDVDAACRRREEADAERPGRSLHRPRVPPPRRLHDPGRRLARLDERQDGDGQQRGQRAGVQLRQDDAQATAR